MSPVGVGPPLFSTARQQFIWRLTSPVYWLPSVAVLTSPTLAEINSGLDLRHALVGVAGFRAEQDRRNYVDVQQRVTVQRPGGTTFEPSGLRFHEDLVDQVIRTYLAPGTSGFVGLMPYGRVAGRRMEIWPCTTLIEVMDDGWDLDNSKAATFTVPVAITRAPELRAVIPA